jgi:hypothetical protein
MLEMLKLAVLGAKRNGRHIGICGEAPANYPEIARYLAELGIDSISVNPLSRRPAEHSPSAAVRVPFPCRTVPPFLRCSSVKATPKS